MTHKICLFMLISPLLWATNPYQSELDYLNGLTGNPPEEVPQGVQDKNKPPVKWVEDSIKITKSATARKKTPIKHEVMSFSKDELKEVGQYNGSRRVRSR